MPSPSSSQARARWHASIGAPASHPAATVRPLPSPISTTLMTLDPSSLTEEKESNHLRASPSYCYPVTCTLSLARPAPLASLATCYN
jgi:hypothetical protein